VPMAVDDVPVNAIPFEPQLISVGNYRFDNVTQTGDQRVLVDFTFETDAGENVDTMLGLTDAEVPGLPPFNGGEFYLIGSDSAAYEGQFIAGISQVDDDDDDSVVTVAFATDPSVIPVNQLRRGVVVVSDSALTPDPGALNDEDPFTLPDINLHLTEEFEGEDDPNGITTDPDLVEVERVSNTSYRFEFDEAVDDEPASLDPDWFFLYDSEGDASQATAVVRSATVEDAASVVIATFDPQDDDPGDPDTPVGAFILDSAVQGTDQIQGTNEGFSRPAEAALQLPDDEVIEFTPGLTDLPDLLRIVRTQNQVTGNWTVRFVFDQPGLCGDEGDVDFDLYDDNGVQFRATGVFDGDPGVTCSANLTSSTVTFSVDDGLNDSPFDNEQIESAVTGGVQDFEEPTDGPTWSDQVVTEARQNITEG